ncbi:hypothetical protein PTTG_01409 [Puccinia triticina 1-1 BBBD Race 1]|uniref:Uncharacterized protein n=1 Tax=Puccinia triticina (isolate 1-1 / race 1 (BBBD)) TaxID=630390 RepID=A0A0C4EKX9_PUCT1|nr:hypothetical protein PTTG_01409 [Puccinia triticina 1-1 BBBD Race 1]
MADKSEGKEISDKYDAPCTPPNTTCDSTNVPQSTGRESSRIRTPSTRPGFVPTLTKPRRAAVPNSDASGTPRAKSKPKQVSESVDIDGPTNPSNERGRVKQTSRRTGQVIDVDTIQDSDEENRRAPAFPFCVPVFFIGFFLLLYLD